MMTKIVDLTTTFVRPPNNEVDEQKRALDCSTETEQINVKHLHLAVTLFWRYWR